MRFEAVHQYFKHLVKQTKSFVNVTASLRSRFQRRKCYELAINLLSFSATIVNGAQHIVTVLSLPSSLRVVLLQTHDICEASTILSA